MTKRKLQVRNRILFASLMVVLIFGVSCIAYAFIADKNVGTVMENVNIENYDNSNRTTEMTDTIGGDMLGGTTTPGMIEKVSSFNLVSLKDSDTDVKIAYGVEYDDIGSGENTSTFCNETNETLYITESRVMFYSSGNGVASSSFIIDVATTTRSSGLADYVDPYASIIDSFKIATSSIATTSTLTINMSEYKKGTSTIPVYEDECVGFIIQNTSELLDSAAGFCDGFTCEDATSTNRGFNMKWLTEYYYLKGD